MENLRQEREVSVIVAAYEEKGREHTTAGFFYGVKSKVIDLRNFGDRIQDIGRLTTGYQCLNISADSFIDYRVL